MPASPRTVIPFPVPSSPRPARAVATFAAVAVLVVGAALPSAPSRAADADPQADAARLQRRLTDAGCYKGAIDGLAGEALEAAVRRCPDQEPILKIEAGMHTASINRIGVDGRCDLLATTSDDATVRLWSLPGGTLQRTIRLPISGINGGKVFALALSADGRWLAVGRQGNYAVNDRSRTSLYLFDVAVPSRPRLMRRTEFGSRISAVAFSSDGSRVALGFKGRDGVGVEPGAQGLRVLDRMSGRELSADPDYGGDVYGLRFSPGGDLFTTSADGFVRRYDAQSRLAAKAAAAAGRDPRGIDLADGGKRLVVGYNDGRTLGLLDPKTLADLGAVPNADLSNGNLAAVAWNGAARTLAAAGSAQRQIGHRFYGILRRYGTAFSRSGADVAVAPDAVADVKPCGLGFAYASADPSFGLMGPEGAARTLQGAVTADMRDKRGADFTVSPDGSAVRFGLAMGGESPVLLDVAGGSLVDAVGPGAGLSAADAVGLPVSDWVNDAEPKIAGRPIALSRYELSRSLAVRPGHDGFVLGTDWYLRAYDAQGRERWKHTTPGAAFGVDFADDGRTIVVAEDGGTLHWYRWDDGQEFLTAFVHAKTKQWIAWTPTGYYMASPGGEDLIGWHLNRGWDQEPEFFPASRFRDRFNRPDVVRLVFTTRDEAEAIARADLAANNHEDHGPLTEHLPPVLTVLSPVDGSRAAGTVDLRYSVRSPSGDGIGPVEVFIDGAKVAARGLSRSDSPTTQPDGTVLGAVTVAMPPHDAVVSLVPYAGGRAGTPATLHLKAPPAAPAAGDVLKPTLYALLIGVTHYDRSSLDLGFSAKDAVDFAAALKAQKGGLYRDVQVEVLTDHDATSANMKRGLLWLKSQATSRDLSVVFAAGHGTTDAKGRFWFLTSDADPDNLLVSAVSKSDIADILFDLPGKKVLFLDACHSGAALEAGRRGLERTDIGKALNDFTQAEDGVVAYAAATGREFSFEREAWGHGAFTEALIEGVGQGKADLFHTGAVTTATLDAYVVNRVKELTGGQQHPVMTRPTIVPDFPLAWAK